MSHAGFIFEAYTDFVSRDAAHVPSGVAGFHFWSLPPDAVLAQVHSSAAGLSSDEAHRRLTQAGPNSLKAERNVSGLRTFLNQFKNPVVIILIFAALLSAFMAEWVDAAVVIIIVIGSALLGFSQEYAASAAVAKLRERVHIKSTVLRDGKPAQIPSEDIVSGDVIVLTAGNVVPADGIVLEARDFLVNQAALTGETYPAEKHAGVAKDTASLGERDNCVFAGTHAQSGTARVLIVQTGSATAFGQIASRLNAAPPETDFQRGIRHFGYLLTQIMLLLTFAVFAVNVFFARPPIESLLFAMALAVGLSPELLPAIISINLAKGAQRMAKQGVIVRRLDSIEDLGSMDTLCTDKTGTLTAGVIKLDAALDVKGEPSQRVLRLAALNARLQTDRSNPLDAAIIASTDLDTAGVTLIDEVTYDFARRRLSVIIDQSGQPRTMITKGALESMLDVCVDIDEDMRAGIDQQFDAWSEKGFRVLGVATKVIDANASQRAYSAKDERDLRFDGFLLFFDPPKLDVKQTVSDLATLGVQLKVITGDNRRVARHLADVIGVPIQHVLTGAEINVMSDESLMRAADRAALFAEVDPNQKERIISAIKRAGHVVGYLGDGINDAPALRAADVGVSVDSAVDVAKEAADFVLLEHDLDVLRQGIEQGRVTFANTLKYIFTTTSANFGNMFSMAGATLFLPFLPLTASQILLNNFLSDFPAITIAGDNVDPEWIQSPHRWNVTFIRNFMVVFGLVSSIFDFLTFGVLLGVLQSSPEQFRTGWFIESLLTELIVALVVRTRRPFYRSRPGKWLLMSTLLVALFTLAIPYMPVLGGLFGFVPLPAWFMGVLAGITLLYIVTVEITKRRFFKRYRM